MPPFRPHRPFLAPARAIAARHTAPEVCWAALQAAGLAPPTMTTRHFCDAEADTWTPLEVPASVGDCVALASVGAAGLLQAEALMTEVVRRSVDWLMGPVPPGIIWMVGGETSLEDEDLQPWFTAAIGLSDELEGLRLEMPPVPAACPDARTDWERHHVAEVAHLRRLAGWWRTFADHVLQTPWAEGVVGRRVGELPDLYTPALVLVDSGYMPQLVTSKAAFLAMPPLDGED